MHFFLLRNTIKIFYFVDDQFWCPLTSMILFFPYNGGHWEPKLLVTNIIQNNVFKASHTGLELIMTEFKFLSGLFLYQEPQGFIIESQEMIS